MNILALDLGTQTGWALLQATGITSGSVSFATNRLAGFGVRFLNFRNWLVEMLGKHRIDMVVFEEVHNHAGVYAAHAYGGFVAILASVCETLRLPYRGFGVKTIKKFITGSGNASKQDVINAVRNKGYGPMAEDRPLDDNEADAIALALLAENTLTKENTTMYNNSISGNINSYSAKPALEYREVKIRNAESDMGDEVIFTGPYKYSQVTGKSTPHSR
jgi:Holliday junction resolvasome RuvABC endonuclease subunit